MSKTEHTPTPWRVEIPGDRIVADDHKGTMPIADIRGWGHLTGKGLGALGLSNAEGIAIQEANAAFIVKAVNNHDALVARVKYLEETEDNKILQLKMTLQTIVGMDPQGIRADDLGRASSIARAALATSTGET